MKTVINSNLCHWIYFQFSIKNTLKFRFLLKIIKYWRNKAIRSDGWNIYFLWSCMYARLYLNYVLKCTSWNYVRIMMTYSSHRTTATNCIRLNHPNAAVDNDNGIGSMSLAPGKMNDSDSYAYQTYCAFVFVIRTCAERTIRSTLRIRTNAQTQNVYGQCHRLRKWYAAYDVRRTYILTHTVYVEYYRRKRCGFRRIHNS